MRSVSKKTGVSKKVVRDRRILAKARREDGKRGNSYAPHRGAHTEQPVSEGIRRAAEKIGATPSEAPKPEAKPGAAPESRESMAEWTERRRAIEERPFTITLAEACDLVSRDLSPTDFQTEVFEHIARDLDTLTDLAEYTSGFDGWCAFQNLRSRILLAGKISAVIGGAS